MERPHLLITGASGFIGKHLLDAFKDAYEVTAIARRSQALCGAPVAESIHWRQADISDRAALERVFVELKARGGVDIVIHLAAHYDFTGENHPDYTSTNIDGLRNTLDLCAQYLDIDLFVFASSLAACSFPLPGDTIDEDSPADGAHIYAHSKRLGEEMLRNYRNDFRAVTARFAAVYSDWCEYPPLYTLIGTWLSKGWDRRILAGKGKSAIPYVHVRDIARFMEHVIERHDELQPGEVLLASPDGATSHESLFEHITRYVMGEPVRPIRMPKPLVGPGLTGLCILGGLWGELPFERPWMARYVDQQLTIDARRTRDKLDWLPRERLDIIRRLPFLLENFKAYPLDWKARNEAVLQRGRVRPSLRIFGLLQKHRDEITEHMNAELREQTARYPSYQRLEHAEHSWNHRMALRQLMHAVRTRERALFISYCRDLAEKRFEQGFTRQELSSALASLGNICVEILSSDAEATEVRPFLDDHISTTIRFGIDQVEEVFEDLDVRREQKTRAAG